jgi:cytochrome P450
VSDPIKLGPEYFQDPHAVHARMHAAGPVTSAAMPDGFTGWFVTGYDDARAALNDQRLCKDWRKLTPGSASDDDSAGAEQMLSRHMLNTDPPDHTRLRKLVSKAFTARRVADLRPRVELRTSELLDDLAARPEDVTDLLEAFAFPLPVIVISELLGVPAADRDKFRAWSAAAVSSVASEEEMYAAGTEMIAYFTALLDRKRHNGGDDLLSALVQASEDGDRLSVPELISMVFLLLVAGHETTVNLIASGTLTLLLDPAAHARLHSDRSLLPAAVEEMLRYTSPVNHATLRFTTEPTLVAGTEIPAGQVVVVALSSANRDPARFACPASFDIDRDTSGHIAFGHGIHYCLGAPLARLEAEVAFGGLLDRFPAMTLAVPEADLRWRPSTLIHGLQALPVRLRG